MIKGIIFDMDGVLVNTEPLHYKSYREALKPHGIDLIEEEYYHRWVKEGKGIVDFAQAHGLQLDSEAFRVRRRKIYMALLKDYLEIIPQAPEKVKELSAQYYLALVSSSHSENINAILKMIQLKKYFSVVVGADHVTRIKPAPDGFLLAVQEMHLHPSECVVIEDAEKGILAAHAAGMKSLAIPTEITKNHDFSKATRILKNITHVTPELINSV